MKKPDVLQTTLFIKDGILNYENNFIQTSNITKVCVEDMETKPYPTWIIVGLIISCFALFFPGLQLPAVIAIIVFIIILTAIYMYNSDLGKYVIFSLNSGEKIYFSATKDEFLEEALAEIIVGIKGDIKTVINFNECTIEGSVAGGDIIHDNSNIFENVNTVLQGSNDNNIVINNTRDDFESLSQILLKVMYDYSRNSDEYYCCEMALNYCKDKDSNKMRHFINKNLPVFQNIVGNVAAAGIIELVKRITGIVL